MDATERLGHGMEPWASRKPGSVVGVARDLFLWVVIV